MLQEWADMVDAWIDERTPMPKLLPENLVVPTLNTMAQKRGTLILTVGTQSEAGKAPR